MPEKGSSAREREPQAEPRRVSTEVKLALIEHALRPAAFAFVGILLFVWLLIAGGSIELLKAGPFEAKLREQAEKKAVQKELRELEGLTNEQLQLFLIIGRKRQSELITYSGSEVNEPNLQSLRAAGLLSSFDIEEKEGKDWYRWEVSEKGHQLHQVIFDLLLASIRRLEDS
jgi:hypothetical protein